MQQVRITKKNGVILTEVQTIAIAPERIVSTKADGSFCEFVYELTPDRRIKPDTYTCTNTKTAVDAYISGTKKDLTVYDLALGTTSTLTVQEKYILSIKEAYAVVAGTNTACREVVYNYGSFARKTVYVSNSLASLASAVVTTTTTAAAVTTTTTAPVTTTTTTAA